MNRYKNNQGGNEHLPESFDTGFLGVNALLDPGLLRTGSMNSDVNQNLAMPGMVSHAVNMRFRRGVAETRPGIIAPVCYNPRNTDTAAAPYPANLLAGVQGNTLHADGGGVLLELPTGRMVYMARATDYGGEERHTSSEPVGGYWMYSSGTSHTLKLAGTTVATGSGNASPWLATWTGGYKVTNSPLVDPWSARILAVCPFSDPDGEDWLMVVQPHGVYRCGEGSAPWLVGLPPGVVLEDPVELIQTFNGMVLLRGFDHKPLTWDGASAAFELIPDADPEGSYTSSIPPAIASAVISNRLCLVMDRDTVAVSDILDYTRYDAALNAFRVNTGEDDGIVAIHPYRKTNLLVFKDGSLHAIGDVKGDLSTIFAEVVHSGIGCVARKSVATVGGDVFFLSHDGVYRVGEVIQDSLQVSPTPISQAIEPILRRMNWSAVGTACAVAHGDYYRLAVPLDGATRPNVVLVYDTSRSAWQGYDEYAGGFCPEILAKANWLNRKRAIAVDRELAVVAVLDEGWHDLDVTAASPLPYPLVVREAEIASEVRTRGYLLTDDGPKRFRHGFATVQTWNPSLTINVRAEGVNEVDQVKGPITKSRTKYYTFGRSAWVATNANDDHEEPKREDYSVVIPNGGLQLHSGVKTGLKQQSQEHFAIRRQAGWIAVELVSTQGYFSLSGAGVDGAPRRNVIRTMA